MPAPEHPTRKPGPRPAPDLLADEMSVLLHEGDTGAAAARRMHTQRHADTPLEPLADGVGWRGLYSAPALTLRSGEPQRCGLLELAAGAQWPSDAAPCQREWLLLREARAQAAAPALPQRAAEAPWADYAAGIERRMLAQHGARRRCSTARASVPPCHATAIATTRNA